MNFSIPLPAFKQTNDGGLEFCPRCAYAWLALVAIATAAWLLWKYYNKEVK